MGRFLEKLFKYLTQCAHGVRTPGLGMGTITYGLQKFVTFSCFSRIVLSRTSGRGWDALPVNAIVGSFAPKANHAAPTLYFVLLVDLAKVDFPVDQQWPLKISPPPPRHLCKNKALVRPTRGVVSAAFGTVAFGGSFLWW